MRIAVFPAQFVTDRDRRESYKFLRSIKAGLTSGLRKFETDHLLCAEVMHYSALPKYADRVYVLGNFYQEYVKPMIGRNTHYRSLGFAEGFVPFARGHLSKVISDVDAVLVSARSKDKKMVIQRAKELDKVVVIIDHFDDPDIYDTTTLTDTRIYRAVDDIESFDLYLKHDVPIGLIRDKLIPIAPMPTTLAPHQKRCRKKDLVIFAGRFNYSDRPESARAQFIENLRPRLPYAAFYNTAETPLSRSEFSSLMCAAKICISPPGKVWDSTRHTESVVFKALPLITKPNCEIVGELTGAIFNDSNMENRVEEILSQNSRYVSSFDEWVSCVRAFHSLDARARILVEKLGALLR